MTYILMGDINIHYVCMYEFFLTLLDSDSLVTYNVVSDMEIVLAQVPV